MTYTKLIKLFLIAGVLTLGLLGLSASHAAESHDSGTQSSQAKISLNFKDADIRKVAESIGQITGKNFILDPQVRGRVTLISSQPIPASAVYSVFLSVLEVHGFAAIPAGSATKIIPALKARQAPGVKPAHVGSVPGDAMVTRVVTVQNVPAPQLIPVLRPLMSTQANLTAYQPSNVLVISDRADNVKRILRIIQRIDQIGQHKIDIVPLKYASATDLVRVLTRLLAGAKNRSAHPVKLAADARTNSILIGGGQSERLQVKALIAELDTPQKQGGSTQVVYLNYAKAGDIAKVLNGYLTAREKLRATHGKSSGREHQGAAVIPDEGTNSLVITAPPKTMRAIKQVVAQLDIRRAEVFVQAIIAEISSDRSAELGITWAADAIQGAGAAGLTNFGGTGAGVAQLAGAAAAGRVAGTSFGGSTGAAAALSSIPDGLSLAVGKIVKGGFSFAALLHALAGNSQTNILSAPSLVTLDNEKAKITVGQQVPFLTGSYASGGTNNGVSNFVNPFQTINRKQVGITLEITPQVNQGNTVNLKIHQTVSSIAGSSSGAVDLVTNNREIKTDVIAKSGQIIVLGGLMQNNQRTTEQKVPLLGDIPLIGNLFKYRSNHSKKQNLLVFIRPTILRDSKSVSYYTNKKYNALRNFQLNYHNTASLIPESTKPVLPPFNAIVPIPSNNSHIHYEPDDNQAPARTGAKTSHGG